MLGGLEAGRYADASAIAESTGAPPNYLSKLLGQLAKAGIVEGKKGAGGGFRLAKKPGELNLREALSPVERLVSEGECILGRSDCDGDRPCALHARWAAIRMEMVDFLESTKLDDLSPESLG